MSTLEEEVATSDSSMKSPSQHGTDRDVASGGLTARPRIEMSQVARRTVPQRRFDRDLGYLGPTGRAFEINVFVEAYRRVPNGKIIKMAAKAGLIIPWHFVCQFVSL